MVFVHARKETVKTAQKLKEMATEEGALDVFDTRDHPKFQLYRRDVGTSRNKEMKELFDYGFGIHHAGMLRSDRNMMERMFEDNAIKVLCCTSTLAWGVNLPAHAVIIKGTQVYDSNKGSFQDLSVLDVLQIFGRAGRPGYETSGVGYICTTQDKLDHYLYSIMSQQPIESKFIPGCPKGIRKGARQTGGDAENSSWWRQVSESAGGQWSSTCHARMTLASPYKSGRLALQVL
ncbi:RNA helicase [Trichosporon asahii var. asahii CBS 2479]|uniref:RNA helicase n=1 Tax=Trichosporon asahii var. asahii (strain ATCC 90039 / CBS 2479 / JCM 2466 / KCTC 7840 / NBRC 103889/ NCYC 2677 / UAMH 7654) TaxID=1186058 RepID=J5RIE7_TRIAS|nr:RNA helicase [Trichosporon asahii var. asahii CBS 2479]EJT52818.1 RNA helicase [Trichosporon asahii var. asahii CBS 2479]